MRLRPLAASCWTHMSTMMPPGAVVMPEVFAAVAVEDRPGERGGAALEGAWQLGRVLFVSLGSVRTAEFGSPTSSLGVRVGFVEVRDRD